MATLTNKQAAELIAGMRANHEQHELLPLCAEALRMAEAALRGQQDAEYQPPFAHAIDVLQRWGMLPAEPSHAEEIRAKAMIRNMFEEAAPAAPADVMADADRFAWWFGGHREASDEIVRLWLAELTDNPPSLDEWRKAIDAARAEKGAT